MISKKTKYKIKQAAIATLFAVYLPTMAFSQTLPGSGVTTGTNATAGDQSVADGDNANATAINSVAVGFNPYANINSIAIGSLASASAQNAEAIGYFSSASALGGLAFGYQAMVAAMNGIAIGPQAYATGVNDISLGNTAGTPNSGGNNTNLGAGAGNTTTSGLQSMTNVGVDAGQGNTTSYATAIGANTQVTGTNSVALGYGSVSSRNNDVSVGTPGSPRTISNVATATEGDEAINLNQLNAALSGVTSSVNPLAVTYNNASLQDITLAASGTQIHNLAAGVADTDAANLGQVKALVNTAQTTLQTEINNINTNTGGTGTGTTTSNTDANAVHYDNGNSGSVTLNGTGQIHNVQAGTSADDVVNVAQLEANTQAAYQYTNTVAANTLSQANSYTDQQIAGVNSRIDNLSNRINGVAAMALAQGSAMQPTGDNTNSLTVGVAGFRGASGYSVAYYHKFSSNIAANVGIAGATQAAGIGYFAKVVYQW